MGPAPISWQPSQYWDGDAGLWSSFALRVGKPEQTVRVIPSTAGRSTWVVTPSGCPAGIPGTSPSSTCSDSRGGLLNTSQSISWHSLSNNSLGIDANLGYGEMPALYGLDTINLGFTDSMGGPKLKSQLLAALASEHYFIGLFGLNHQATNLTNFTDPQPSALSTMKKKNLIPSLSWAYTAGAKYRSKGVFGSLTFGGYDNSRFVSNSLSFNLAPDITRDLVVGVHSITSNAVNHSTIPLLSSPILAFIDSTQPDLYLPLESCQAFENAFGLVWNKTAKRYWVDDNLHQTLQAKSPNITFTIGNNITGGPTTDIVLPYASFDLQATSPAVAETTRYFPLQRAADESQYTLGRTFMQEAYVITDYERSIFSVSQAKFEDGISERIVPIRSTTPVFSHMTYKAIIGIVVGAIVFLLLLVLCIACFLRRRGQKLRRQVDVKPLEYPSIPQNPKNLTICSVREIHPNSIIGEIPELPNNGKAELQDEQSPSGSGKEMSEMAEAPPPVLHELRTHRSSMERVMIEANRASACKILKSTHISTKSFFGVDSTDGTPCMETVISASAREGKYWGSCADHIPKPLHLDRSLPPTPISESPMVSPLTPEHKKSSSLRRRSRSVELTPRLSKYTFVSRRRITSKYPQSLATHEPPPRSSSLKGMEAVIPPWRSKNDIPPLSGVEEIRETQWI